MCQVAFETETALNHDKYLVGSVDSTLESRDSQKHKLSPFRDFLHHMVGWTLERLGGSPDSESRLKRMSFLDDIYSCCPAVFVTPEESLIRRGKNANSGANRSAY